MRLLIFLFSVGISISNPVVVVQPQGYIPVTYIPAMQPSNYMVQQVGGMVQQVAQPAANFVNNSVQAVPQSMRDVARYSRSVLKPRRENYHVKCRNLGLLTAAYGFHKDNDDLKKIGAGMVIGQRLCGQAYKHTVGRVEGPVKGVFHGTKGLVTGTVGQFFR